MPTKYRVEVAMSTSTHSRALPMSMLENRLRIMARMSVPPVELCILNRMAEPREGRMTAKNSSRVFWSVRGADRGTSHSRADSMAENRMEQ